MFEVIPKVDRVIDAAANPSVLAGVNGSGTSRQLFEHNLASIVNVLEYCKTHGAGFLLLSTSRVYSITALADLPLKAEDGAFRLDCSKVLRRGVSDRGIDADFSIEAPISLYGSTKLSSETVALEYGLAFGFPVWINRCGVLAGAGQYGNWPSHFRPQRNRSSAVSESAISCSKAGSEQLVNAFVDCLNGTFRWFKR